MVDKIVTITPRHIRLAGSVGQPVVGEASVLPERKYPFEIVGVSARDGKNISVDLRENKHENGTMGYVISVRNIRPDGGRYLETLTLKTTSQYRPEIKLRVTGYFN